MNAQELLRWAVANRYHYARQWQERTGGRVVGYLCTCVPEELLYAAGLLPVRVMGSHWPSDVTEPYISSRYCPYCRDVLAQGLLGRYDYLDGIVYAHTCIHIGQAFACRERHLPTEYTYFIYMPAAVQSPAALPRLVQADGLPSLPGAVDGKAHHPRRPGPGQRSTTPGAKGPRAKSAL